MFSIIVATRNAEKYIAETIKSIVAQDFPDFELLIIDAKSDDATLDIVRSFNLPRVTIVSEPDRGIGDAWNKGLRLAKGSIIGMLGSDDYYDLGTFVAVDKVFSKHHTPVIGFGDVTIVDPLTGYVKKVIGKSRGKFGLLNGFGFLHPSVFFNKLALEKIGFFDAKQRIAMDTDWLLRGISSGVTFVKIPSHTYMRLGGVSDVNKYAGMGEYLDALVRNGYSDVYIAMFFAFRFLGQLRSIFKMRFRLGKP